ncbi:flagellin [Halobiforma lacisalsi AJ5]|uniref:Flagellin n=1 Tax=Natronobacterium lacisalsi AJ5 TaxID=358396 RepID=M0LXJ7_NATLA|nr:flagellin [Halobiforma lacisalsi]APW97388.1 flagellin [Halobiforma lacisalsi AJ5]EMA38317.1 flagellin [Halobiforma lacisalsi AJ5]
MSSVTATHLIMFVASLVVASAVAGTVIMEVTEVGSSIETRGSAVAEEIDTEIEIISDETKPNAMVEEDADGNVVAITVLVKNIGDESVDTYPGAVDALVDGSYTNVQRVERVDSDTGNWGPNGVVEIEIDTTDREISGDTEVAIIVNGNEDAIDFYY